LHRLAEQLEDLAARLRVEVAGRLVGEHDARLRDQRTGDRHALLLTAEENVTLPLTIAGEKIERDWVDQLIGSVGLKDRRHHRPSELSGGQQQRVALARALVTRPKVVFADEPTGNLDSASSGEVLELLRRSVDELGQTTVMVTHDPRAAAMADRILFIADGRIVKDISESTAVEVLAAMQEVTGR